MPEQTFETKAMNGQLTIDEAEGIVEAFVAGIGNKDSVGDIVLPGAFDASLKRRKPRVVWGHNWNEPIGKVLEIYEVGPRDPRLPEKMKKAGIGGLFARVQFNLKSERGREAFANILFFGAEQEWSIGYKTITAAYDNARQANLLREVELYEVSPVLHGANQLTGTISIKSDNGDDRVTSFRKSKWPMFDRSFAEMIKEEHPEIWDAGGNIKGDDQYTILTRIAEQGGVAKTEDQIAALELREAWVARHEGDFRLPGVIAQIKWLAIGSRGEDHMKNVVREAIAKKTGTKGHGEGYSIVADIDDEDPMEELARIAERMRVSDNDESEEEDEDEERPSMNDSMGRRAVLARAIANEMRAPVRIRTITGNTVVFDVMGEDEPETMRASWHAEDGRVMVGRPERVRVETVYVPMDGGEGEAYMDDEQYKATDPRAGIPQERITGDILRGYGPRRGNLERLLRYWRPIMRKPGGFRRCLVILADHPELYPLQNICAWLHHETTGLWPNEGCHHPGMKNCRRKLRGVVRGSLWSDSEFNNRLRRMRPDNDGKGMPDPFDWDDEKGYGEVTDDDIEYANKVLNWFAGEEKEFMQYLADEKNWMHDGEDEDGNWMEHEWVKPEGAPVGVAGKPHDCGCGCQGKGSCGPKSLEDSLAELEEKVGRVLNSRNSAKITQAIQLLTEVLGEGAPMPMERKGDLIPADIDELFDLKEALDPVLEYHGLEAECREDGIVIFGLEGEEAEIAIKSVLGNFDEIQYKSIGRTIGRAGRRIPRDGDGDGMFSPAPGAPDKTPVPPHLNMESFKEEIRQITTPHLNNKLKKAKRDHDAMPDGPDKDRKKLEIEELTAEQARRVRKGGDAKPEANKPQAAKGPNGLAPYPKDGTAEEQSKWREKYKEKIRFLKRDKFEAQRLEAMRRRSSLPEGSAERATADAEVEVFNSVARQRSAYGRQQAARRGGGTRRGNMVRYRVADPMPGQPEYVWFDENTDDAYDAIRDGFILPRPQ